jgi:hypothetical protein
MRRGSMLEWCEGTLLIKKHKDRSYPCAPKTLLMVSDPALICELNPELRTRMDGAMVLEPNGKVMIYYIEMLDEIYEPYVAPHK